MIGPEVVGPLLEAYLPKQRWFGAKDREVASVTVHDLDCLQGAWPGVMHTLALVEFASGPPSLYQMFLGLRPDGEPADFLHGHADAVIGNVETEAGAAYAYDGLLDAEINLALLARIAPKEAAWRPRPVGTEQSNTSIVFDDRIIMKVFRRLYDGPNPDVEISAALADHGFKNIAIPIAQWSHGGRDLAVVQEYLAGGVEGWALALTSLRDVYDTMCDPAEAGGDFYPEAHRLGEVTAQLHVAMADAFGVQPATPAQWADAIAAQIDAMRAPAELDVSTLRMKVEQLRALPPDRAGPSLRVHGDFHLGQVMRTDSGWHVLDFEGEPARPLEERRKHTSPLKDVAGMLRSLQYAAHAALLERDELAEGVPECADRWERRNREAFLAGYTTGVDDRILPPGPEETAIVMTALEVEKAVYELAYEQANRPDWVAIPLAALERLAAS